MRSAIVEHHFNEAKYKLLKTRLIIYIITLLVFLSVGIFLCHNLVRRIEIAPIKYCDSGSPDYRVYLKENEFYNVDFLPKGQSYPTSLIDYIEFNYNYIFNIDDLANMEFEYTVIGELIIEDNSNKKVLLNNPYTIVDKKTKQLRGTNEIVINEKFKIDYAEYNNFANKYRSSSFTDTNSYLKLYMKVKRNTSEGSKYTLEKGKETVNLNEIKIPLSEKSIDINIDTQNGKKCEELKFSEKQYINYFNLAVAIINLIIALFLIKKIIYTYKRMLRRRSEYDKYVAKLLKEYDRLIVVTKTLIDFRKYNIIKVPAFDELLDVRDNLKVPINYYCYVKHLKGIFYIKSDDDIYALFLSTEMLEKDK